MALAKVYRAAYTIDGSEYPRVYFSEWVTADGMEQVENELDSMGGNQEGEIQEITTVIVGWEVKELDTEPLP